MGRVVSGNTKKIGVLECKAESISEDWVECFEYLDQQEVAMMTQEGVLAKHHGHDSGSGLIGDVYDISKEVLLGIIPFESKYPIEDHPEYQSAQGEIENRNAEPEQLTEEEELAIKERMERIRNRYTKS